MNTTTKTAWVDGVKVPAVEHADDFGVFDDKGRAVGARALEYMDGAIFCLQTSATRGGKDFGASQGTKRYESLPALRSAIAKYFAGARSRAVKGWIEYRPGKWCAAHHMPRPAAAPKVFI